MPYSPKQRTAIFLNIKRRKGQKAAVAFMHKHGHGGDQKAKDRREALKRRQPARKA
jgi:hypothetical protein